MSVCEATVEIRNRLGLHLRAASALAQTAGGFAATVTIWRGKNQTNARSVTGLMMLGAAKGAKVKIRAEGADAGEALKAVRALFDDGFGED